MLLYDNRSLWRFAVLLLLIPVIYAAFGWSIAQQTEAWGNWLTQGGQLAELHILVERAVAHKLLYGLSLLLILSITFGLTIWARNVVGLFGFCFRSDITAIVAVLFWSLVLALIICFFHYFAEFLLLFGSAILGRLELQEAGYNNWQICSVLTAICVVSFAVGLLGFDWWNFMSSTLRSSLLSILLK